MRIKIINALSVVLIALCINTRLSAEETDVITGFLRPVYINLANLIPPGTLVGHGPMEVNIGEDNILYSETGLSREKDAEYLKLILSVFTMTYGTAFLQENTHLVMLTQRMGVLPILNRLKIMPYDHVTEESGQLILNNLGVDHLIVGQLLNVDGKWIIRFDDGNGNSVESDLLDQEAMVRLIKRAKEYFEGQEKSDPPDDTKEVKEENPPTDEASLPVDRANKVIFRTDGIRSPSFENYLNANTFIAVYPPIRNSANASTQASFIIFNQDAKIIKTNNNSHKDTINGVLINADIDEFYTYSDDGVVIAHSLSTFNELYRLVNTRPVKTLSLTHNGFLITNPGNSDSKTFSVVTKAEVRQQSAADSILQNKDVISDINFNIRNGIIVANKKDGSELFQLAFFLDNEYGIIFQNSKKYSGSNLIEHHLDILEYNRPVRPFEKKDRDMRV
jgi:hypothetical protein